MKVTTISCKKVFSTGVMYEPEHIGMEAELDPGEDPIAAYSQLRSLIMKSAGPFFLDRNETSRITNAQNPMPPNECYDGPPLKPTNDEPLRFHAPKDKNEQRAQIIADIQTCTELKVLESYKILAKNHPDIQKAYDSKKIELDFPFPKTSWDVRMEVLKKIAQMDVSDLKDGDIRNINSVPVNRQGDFGINNKREISRYENGIWVPLKS